MEASSVNDDGKYVLCNICGNDDYSVLFPPGVAQANRIVRCNHCGLIYANPRSIPIDLDLVKENMVSDLTAKAWFRARDDKERLQVADYAILRREMGRLFPGRGKLLEIGSSFGYSLKAWQDDGWDVVGIEPMAEGARYTGQRFGIGVHPTTLAEARLPSGFFDVIVMLHVIEHLDDPCAELREILRVMKPGGRFICETPRFDSLMFKLLGKRERSLVCDGHIYFFETATLEALTRKAGFEVESVQLVGRSLTLERLAWNLGRISKSELLQKMIGRFCSTFQLRRFRIRLNMRDMQLMTLVKPA